MNIALKPLWWWVQTGSQDPSSDATSLQNAFDDLFFTYQVDLAFYGHIHYYTRSACYRTVPVAIVLMSAVFKARLHNVLKIESSLPGVLYLAGGNKSAPDQQEAAAVCVDITFSCNCFFKLVRGLQEPLVRIVPVRIVPVC